MWKAAPPPSEPSADGLSAGARPRTRSGGVSCPVSLVADGEGAVASEVRRGAVGGRPEGLARWLTAARSVGVIAAGESDDPADGTGEPRRAASATAGGPACPGGLASPARVVAVTGGKGGVGKSNVSLNLCVALAARGRQVLLVDCDSGLGNIDVLLGICPSRHLGHVLTGECDVESVVLPGPPGVDLLPAAGGLDALGQAGAGEAARLIDALSRIEACYDVIVLDTSAGLGPRVRELLSVAPEVLVVTTPEPTALADAYATLKVLHATGRSPRVGLLVNMAASAREAEEAGHGLQAVSTRYLDWRPEYLGSLPEDPAVPQAVRHQRPFLLWSPGATVSRAMRRVADAWFAEATRGRASSGWGLAQVLGFLAEGGGRA